MTQREDIRRLKADPNIYLRFYPFWGKTTVIRDGIDMIAFRYKQLISERPNYPNGHLIDILSTILTKMGITTTRTLDYVLRLNDEIIAYIMITRTADDDGISENILETAFITYDYDDVFWRKYLPDKEYYKEINEQCYADPIETEIDDTKKRFGGIREYYPAFNIKNFRRRIYIKCGQALNVDLLMKHDVKERFFDADAVPYKVPDKY